MHAYACRRCNACGSITSPTAHMGRVSTSTPTLTCLRTATLKPHRRNRPNNTVHNNTRRVACAHAHATMPHKSIGISRVLMSAREPSFRVPLSSARSSMRCRNGDGLQLFGQYQLCASEVSQVDHCKHVLHLRVKHLVEGGGGQTRRRGHQILQQNWTGWNGVGWSGMWRADGCVV